jgi:NAD(P)H-hydrate epimerase
VRRLRPSLSDKRQYGRIFVLGGSRNYPGAVLMTCQAAVRAGAGLVTGMVPNIISNRLGVGAPEAMWLPLPIKPEGSFEIEGVRLIHQAVGDAGIVVIGPGLQVDRANTFFISRLVRECPLPMILDASGLNGDVINAVVGRSRDAGPVIVTPHMGEYHRIAGVKDDPTPEEVRAFAEKYHLTVVLKGSVTLITDGRRIAYAGAGNPVLARGGSGDLLAGILAARLAVHPDDPMIAACEGVLWHGEAADALARARGEVGVKTTEILDYLSPALRDFDR